MANNYEQDLHSNNCYNDHQTYLRDVRRARAALEQLGMPPVGVDDEASSNGLVDFPISKEK